jgi:hypothetical protein
MGILVPETCWGNKTAYFVATSWFFTFTMSTMHGHVNVKRQVFPLTASWPRADRERIDFVNQT